MIKDEAKMRLDDLKVKFQVCRYFTKHVFMKHIIFTRLEVNEALS